MKYIIKKYLNLVGIQRLGRAMKTDSFKGYESGRLNCGFSYVEVLLSAILLAIIAAGIATAFYVPSSGMKSIEFKQLAYTYAQREMEVLINRNFDEVSVGTNRTEYMDDNFEYSIITALVGNQSNIKNVRILFYPNPDKGNIGESSDILSDLVNNIVKVGILETFNDGNYKALTFDWTNSPSGHWNIVNFDGSPASRYSHPSHQTGDSYPSSGWPISPSNNYLVEGRVYISRTDTASATSWAAIGGRCTTGGVGYYVRIDVEPSIPGGRTRVSLMNTDTTLLQTPYSGSLYFNQWVTLGLRMIGSNISYYIISNFDNRTLGTFPNSTLHTAGIPFLRAETGGNNRNVYFDDIRIEFP